MRDGSDELSETTRMRGWGVGVEAQKLSNPRYKFLLVAKCHDEPAAGDWPAKLTISIFSLVISKYCLLALQGSKCVYCACTALSKGLGLKRIFKDSLLLYELKGI